jgi:hypothetical protein
LRRFFVLLLAVGSLAVVGGVSADTGALPGPLAPDTTNPFNPSNQPVMQATPFPWGGGYVRSSPYLVDCPFACIRPFDLNTVVTLTATPTSLWTFLGWQVANHGQPAIPGACPGTGTCTVTMDQAKDVVALFQPPTQPQGLENHPAKCVIPAAPTTDVVFCCPDDLIADIFICFTGLDTGFTPTKPE